MMSKLHWNCKDLLKWIEIAIIKHYNISLYNMNYLFYNRSPYGITVPNSMYTNSDLRYAYISTLYVCKLKYWTNEIVQKMIIPSPNALFLTSKFALQKLTFFLENCALLWVFEIVATLVRWSRSNISQIAW